MENYNNAQVIIKQIDASDSNGLISIQVCGEIANNNEAPRKFIQSFVLKSLGNKQYRIISDVFQYVDKIGTTKDIGSVVKDESVLEETPLVVEPVVQTSELEVPTALENVESNVSQTNSSPVGKANKNVDEPAETVTDKKQVKKESEEASPNAEEQKTEEAAPVVEEPPKPVVKPAASTYTKLQKPQQKVASYKGWGEVKKIYRPVRKPDVAEIQKSQQKVVAAKKTWEKVKETPKSVGKPPVANFKEIQELQLKAAAVKNTQQKVDPYKGWGGVKKLYKPVRKPNVANLKEIQKTEQNVALDKKTWSTLVANNGNTSYPNMPVIKVLPKPVQALKEVS